MPKRTGSRPGLALLVLLAGACAPSASVPRPAPVAVAAAPAAAPILRDALSPAEEAWVERTLASLSTRDKIAQLIMPWVGGDYVSVDSPEFDQLLDWVAREKVGGLVVSVGMPLSYAAKLNELQRRAEVPLLVASDMENGPGMRMGGIYSLPHLLPQGGGTTFPPVMALGASGSDSLAYQLGRVLGREARAVGVHLTFGPVLDVNSNPANPIINTRSFGEDPALVARLARAYMRGARDAGLMTTGKHFPGHGDTNVDSHIDLPTISADVPRLQQVDLVPFRAAVEGGIDAIMTAHIAVVGVEGPDAPPATLSPYFMTEVLRGELGFRGVLFTDAMTMGGVARRYGATEPLVRALEAGADVLLMPRDVRQAIETVMAAVRGGRITEARLDASVRRVLTMKARAGLDRERLVALEAVDEVVGARAHADAARAIAERSLTLVRDERGLVPAPRTARRIVSITYADDSDLVAGRAFDRTLGGRGAEVVELRLDQRSTAAELDSARAAAAGAELVVASVYVSPRESAGSIGTHGGFAALLEEMATAGAPLVTVSFGSPYVLSRFPSVPTYLLAWGGAEVSQVAAARALLGEIPISGRLPISLPPHFRMGTGLARPAGDAAESR